MDCVMTTKNFQTDTTLFVQMVDKRMDDDLMTMAQTLFSESRFEEMRKACAEVAWVNPVVGKPNETE